MASPLKGRPPSSKSTNPITNEDQMAATSSKQNPPVATKDITTSSHSKGRLPSQSPLKQRDTNSHGNTTASSPTMPPSGGVVVGSDVNSHGNNQNEQPGHENSPIDAEPSVAPFQSAMSPIGAGVSTSSTPLATQEKIEPTWSGSPFKMILFKKADDHNNGDDDGDEGGIGTSAMRAYEEGMMKGFAMLEKGIEKGKALKEKLEKDEKVLGALSKGMEMMERGQANYDKFQEMQDQLVYGNIPGQQEQERRTHDVFGNPIDLYDRTGLRLFAPVTDALKRHRFFMRQLGLNYEPSWENTSHIRGTGIETMDPTKKRHATPLKLVKGVHRYESYVDSCKSVVSARHFQHDISQGRAPKTRYENVQKKVGNFVTSILLSKHGKFLKAAKEGDLGRMKKIFQHMEGGLHDLGDDFNRTPLYWAGANGHLDCVKFLVEHGADLYKADDNKRTVFYWARLNRHRDVLAYLRNKAGQKD